MRPKELEKEFFKLGNDQILSLGFDIDLTNALRISREYLEKIEIDLDRENGVLALKSLEKIKDIVDGLNDESLRLYSREIFVFDEVYTDKVLTISNQNQVC